jgi:hypothetical protein
LYISHSSISRILSVDAWDGINIVSKGASQAHDTYTQACGEVEELFRERVQLVELAL